MIIDFHCHVFPDKIASKAIASLCKSGGTTPFLNGTVKDLRRSMKESGISYSVILPIATKPSQVVSINDFVISQHKKEGIISFGAIHPLYEHWEEELCRLKEAGIPGIKLHPDFQGLFVDDESMVVVMERAAELGMMILVHGGMEVSFPASFGGQKPLSGFEFCFGEIPQRADCKNFGKPSCGSSPFRNGFPLGRPEENGGRGGGASPL